VPDPAQRQPVDATCPRCGAAFHCGMHDDQPCACTSVTLSSDRLAALQSAFDGCLCLACLRAQTAAESPA
jgi:hypothetical protein